MIGKEGGRHIIEGDLYESHISSLNLPRNATGNDAKVAFLEGGAGNEGKEFK